MSVPMPADELWNKRFIPASAFGKGWAQPCLSKVLPWPQGGYVEPGGLIDCPNVLKLDVLTEGAIWQCAACNALHEFYTEVTGKDGAWLKYGVVRLLKGEHARTSGEPVITEFMED